MSDVKISFARVGRAFPGSRRERRRGSRRPVAYVRCWSPTPGIILNASRRGVAIESFRPFERGESVFLTGDFPGEAQRLPGSVRWCRQIATAGGSKSPVYQVGIALARSLEEPLLAALVQAGGGRAGEPRERSAAVETVPPLGGA